MSNPWKWVVNSSLPLLLFSAFSWASDVSALKGGKNPQRWEKIEGNYCEIFYFNEKDLKKIDRKINISFISLRYGETTTIIKNRNLSEKVRVKCDTIFKKAEEILDMYPRRIKVRINIYSNKNQLDEKYYEMFKEENKAVSFYIYKTNTIYISLEDVSEAVLAHEMAHCIIDHYFVILPPIKVKEILATHVDIQLTE